MPKIMIHACDKRINYVETFMVPYLIDTGVSENNIIIFNDKDHLGCLKNYIKSFESLSDLDDYTWHLQDDVLPSSKFCVLADGLLKVYEDHIICGFANKEFYKKDQIWYPENGDQMFYSFPCIGIPNYISIKFVEWFNKIKFDPFYQQWIVANKFVDYLFKLFITDTMNKGKYKIVNFRPCLVEHVDEYVGGSTINKRENRAKALIFEDDVALRKLMRWYNDRRNL